MRKWAALFFMMFLITGCAPRSPGDPGGRPAPNADAAAPGGVDAAPRQEGAAQVSEPRLLLELSLGNAPDQPGQLPARVGGVEDRGPLALAVEGGLVYLADAAKNRIAAYDLQGRLAGAIPAPWLDDQVVDLAAAPAGLFVTSPGVRYTVDGGGRLLGVTEAPRAMDPALYEGKGPWPIGEDPFGYRYERAEFDGFEPVVRRVAGDGSVTEAAAIAGLGEVRDWYVSRDGALYALAYQPGESGVEGVRVFEVLPPVAVSSGPRGLESHPAPEVVGHPVPARIRLTSADWPPLDVTAEVDRWNLWQLLAGAAPLGEGDSPSDWGPHTRRLTLEAALPDGTALVMAIRNDELRLDGRRYRIPFPHALYAVIEHLRLSAASLESAVQAAGEVRLVLLDLPGVERKLTADERARLARILAGAMPASSAACPQPLDPPFPRYGVVLEGADWSATLLLRGEHYLQREGGGSALHGGEVAAWVADLLPVPDLSPDDVGYLYLADRLQIGDHDLTRWKNTVVRRLVGAEVDALGYEGVEAFTLTFWVDGEPLEVHVDRTGFTYRGVHHPRKGLTALSLLQGVP